MRRRPGEAGAPLYQWGRVLRSERHRYATLFRAAQDGECKRLAFLHLLESGVQLVGVAERRVARGHDEIALGDAGPRRWPVLGDAADEQAFGFGESDRP